MVVKKLSLLIFVPYAYTELDLLNVFFNEPKS